MSQAPTVSVILPVYNAERYVAKTVESVLAQTFTDFELLITDDGSTDHSFAILQPYAAQDARIQLVRQQNQGISKTRNQMMAQARGELIAVIDHDDIALRDRFQLQVDFLNRHPEVVCVSGAHHLIDEAGRFLTCLALPVTDAEIQASALAGHGSVCHPGAMIRRWALAQVGGYDESMLYAQDLDLWLKLGEIGQLANLEEPILQYRLQTRSASARYQMVQRDEARQACERAWKRRNITGTFEAGDAWRPEANAASRHKFMLQYGWWAFNSGQRWTATLYALKAIAALPFRLAGWKLLAAAWFKLPANAPSAEQL